MAGTQAIKILVIVIALVAFASPAKAEQWNCYDNEYSSRVNSSKVIVVVTADTKNNTGKVKVAGTIHSARYSVKGFDRRWDFGSYAFLIEPNGYAFYYDFSSSDTAKPSMILFCKEVK